MIAKTVLLAAVAGGWAQGPRPGDLGASPQAVGEPGVAWYTTWDTALDEAKRSNRPIFFMAAALLAANAEFAKSEQRKVYSEHVSEPRQSRLWAGRGGGDVGISGDARDFGCRCVGDDWVGGLRGRLAALPGGE